MYKCSPLSGIAAVATIPNELMASGATLDRRGIRVTASDNFGLFGLSRIQGSCDGFMAFPTASLGKEYYAVAYSPARVATQVGIVATADSTVCTVRLPKGTGVNDVLLPNDPVVKVGGTSFTITLQSYGVSQFQSSGDLTGTRVTCDKAVGVSSGNVDGHVRVGQSRQETTSNMVGQMTETGTLGLEHYICHFPGRTLNDIIKIVTTEANTKVTITGTNVNHVSTISSEGTYVTWQLPTSECIAVVGDKKILVAQFALSGQITESNSNPLMLVVPAASQWRAVYTFSTGRSGHIGQTHYMMLIIEESRTTKLVYNKVGLTLTNWKLFANTAKRYQGNQMVISPGKLVYLYLSVMCMM